MEAISAWYNTHADMEMALWVAREIGEDTFRRYHRGDAEIVDWIDGNLYEFWQLFHRGIFRRIVYVANL